MMGTRLVAAACAALCVLVLTAGCSVPAPEPEEPTPVPESLPFTYGAGAFGDRKPSAGIFREIKRFEDHDTVLYLFERSAAMDGDVRAFTDETGTYRPATQMERARTEVIRLVSFLPSTHLFNVAAYDCGVEACWPDGPVPATPENIAQAREWVRAIQPEGQSAPGHAITQALDRWAGPENGEVGRVVFLVAGHRPDCDAGDPGLADASGHAEAIEAAVSSRGAKLFVFAVGVDALTRQFLRDIARRGNGTYTEIP